MILWLLIFLCVGCNTLDDSSQNLSSTKDFSENEIGMPLITITRGEAPLVKASSNILIKDQSSDAILKGNVKADFFNEQGEHISQLTSDSAHINQKTNNLHAYGDVKVISDDSVKLFSNSILFFSYKPVSSIFS